MSHRVRIRCVRSVWRCVGSSLDGNETPEKVEVGSLFQLLHQRVPKSIGCLILFPAAVLSWWFMELRLQEGTLAPTCRVYRDPDHRLPQSNARLQTNSDGLRASPEAEDIPKRDFVIFFLGDSFVYGVHLAVAQTLPARIEAGLKERYPGRDLVVINAGWESSSPLLGLRLLKDIGRKYKPDLVLYGFDMTDFRDDLVYRELLWPRGIYRLARPAPASLWLAKSLGRLMLPRGAYRSVFQIPKERFFCVRHPLEETRPDLIPAWESLVEIDSFCRSELDADFCLLVFPRGFQYSVRESPANWEAGEYEPLGRWVLEPFRFFREMKSEAPFEVHSLLPAFQETDIFPTCFSDDPHWTPLGVQVAADDVIDLAIRENWMSLDSAAH